VMARGWSRHLTTRFQQWRQTTASPQPSQARYHTNGTKKSTSSSTAAHLTLVRVRHTRPPADQTLCVMAINQLGRLPRRSHPWKCGNAAPIQTATLTAAVR
jgi:hypothetical protein